jgi:hypothetical protein
MVFSTKVNKSIDLFQGWFVHSNNSRVLGVVFQVKGEGPGNVGWRHTSDTTPFQGIGQV